MGANQGSSRFFLESKKTIYLAIPVVVAQLGITMMGLVDSVMVGRVGVVDLAASAFVNNFTVIFLVFGLGILSSVSVLTSESSKKNGKDHILWGGNTVAIGSALILILGLLFFKQHLQLLGQPPEVTKKANFFYTCSVASFLPVFLFHNYRQFLDGMTFTKVAMVIVLLSNLINAGLNWVLIYGNFGFSPMGLDGAGIATLISRVFNFIAIAAYVHWSPKFDEHSLAFSLAQKKFYIAKAVEVLRLGIPSGLQTVFEVGAFAGAAIIMGWFGEQALAAHQVAISLATVSFMIVLGLSIATSIRVSGLMGEGLWSQARYVGILGVKLAIFIMSLFSILFFLLNHLLPSFYIQDQKTLEIASTLLLVVAAFQLFDGAQAVAVGALRGIKDVVIPSVICFVAYWVLAIPIALLLGFYFKMGPVGIWLGLLTGLLFSALVLNIRFHIMTSWADSSKEHYQERLD